MTEVRDDRYDRQMRLPGFGPTGQARLRSSRILVAGCGALGTVVAEYLVRAGVGTVEIVDRDVVERSNLQRQTLFTESDARRGVPKAEAAKARLAVVNGESSVRAIVADLSPENAAALCARADLLVDCLDNFETRYVLNDCAVARGVPLVHGGAVGFRGVATAILPASGPGEGRLVRWSDAHATPCLACLAPEAPAPGEVDTCDSAGVLGAAAGVVGSIEAGLALRLVAEETVAILPTLVRIDLATLAFSSAASAGARDPACECCVGRRFRHLAPPAGEASPERRPRVLCGQNAVELALRGPLGEEEIEQLGRRLRGSGLDVETERFGGTIALRVASLPAIDAFGARDGTPGRSGDVSDARACLSILAGPASTLAVVSGTSDPEVARAVVARWIGA